MPKENEVLSLISDCRQELQLLHQFAAALKIACATNERFLTGVEAGASLASGSFDDWAYRVTVAEAKPGLLKIADTYDRLQN